MKMKNTLIIIFTYVVACTLTVLLCNAYYKKKLKDEFKRGLFTGIEYHNKHGKYPSYYHWNNKMKNPDFNMDTVLPEPYKLVKAIWVDNDSLRIIRLFNDGHYDTLK